MSDNWILVSERLPDVGPVKPGDKGWLVSDGEREYYTTVHPGWWNLTGEYDDGTKITEHEAPKVVKWLDAPPFKE